MRRCRKIKKWSIPYLNDDLSERKKTYVEAHIESCASCRKNMELLQNVLQLIECDKNEEIPACKVEELLERIYGKLENEEVITENISIAKLAPAFVILTMFIIIGNLIWNLNIKSSTGLLDTIASARAESDINWCWQDKYCIDALSEMTAYYDILQKASKGCKEGLTAP